MPISIEQENGCVRLRPEGEMTIYHVAEYKDAFVDNLRENAEVEINLAQVTEMDTAGFQLLVLAKREAARLGKTLRLTSHSTAALEVIDLYNMAVFLGDPLVISAHKA